MGNAFTGAMALSEDEAGNSYASSFGSLKSGTRYVDGWKEIDARANLCGAFQVGLKALGPTTGGAGTAGYAMIPVYVDPRIVDTTRKFTPLVELIPRVANQGTTADWNKITAKGGAYTANPDAALPDVDDTYDRVSKSIKYLYSVGRVLGPAQAAFPSYILEGFQPSGTGLGGGNPFTPSGAPNAKQLEVVLKARELRELEENLILNGNATTDATQFDGIVVQQSTTNVVDLSGAALSWDDIEKCVRYAFDDGGRPKLAVASSAALVAVRKMMIDLFRYSPSDMTSGANLPFGISPKLVLSTLVGDIPVIPSMYINSAQTAGQNAIYFLDTDYIEMRVLQDMTYQDMAVTNDSQKFMLKIYECLILRNPAFNSFIDNIA